MKTIRKQTEIHKTTFRMSINTTTLNYTIETQQQGQKKYEFYCIGGLIRLEDAEKRLEEIVNKRSAREIEMRNL